MAVTRTYLGHPSSSADLQTYTLNLPSFGTESADRRILVCISARATSTGAITVDSVTIGGVTATVIEQVASVSGSAGNVACQAVAHIPTGASGDIVVTFNRQMARCAMQAYRLAGIDSSTPTIVHESTAADPTVTIDVPAGSVVIGNAGFGGSPNQSVTWTGLTEDRDAMVEAFTSSSASAEFASGATGLTVTAVCTSKTDAVGIFSVWGPPVVSGDPATTATLTGPTTGELNVESTVFSVELDGDYTGTITPASDGSGTFSPTSLTWNGTSETKTFTYTPASQTGTPHIISITANPALTIIGTVDYEVLLSQVITSWSGGLRDTSIVFAVFCTSEITLRIVLSESDDYSSPFYSGSVETDKYNVAKVKVTGLDPSTKYYWHVEIGGVADTSEQASGYFTTMPTAGSPSNFTLMSTTCAGGGTTRTYVTDNISDHPAFLAVPDQMAPIACLFPGDLNYRDTASTDPVYRVELLRDTVAKGVGKLARRCPMDYIYDDHDWKGNGSNGSGPGTLAARQAYDAAVPNDDTPAGSVAKYETWVWGRVRFIRTDLRSACSDQGATDNSSKTRMGADQKAWFKTVLENATEPMIVWINSIPWISNSGSDTWFGYSTERTELANHFELHDITRRLVIVSGDMHMNAIDDGTNSQYATGATSPGPPVFHFSPMDNNAGNIKGGPYSSGTFAHTGDDSQFGTLQFIDDGTNIAVIGTGHRYIESTGEIVNLVSLTVGDIPEPPEPPTSYVGTRPVIAQYIGSQLVTATH